MKLLINFPIINSESSEWYALTILDSSNVTHYFNFDGTYDGYSSNPGIDCNTGVSLN
jgi:hypothetical protein